MQPERERERWKVQWGDELRSRIDQEAKEGNKSKTRYWNKSEYWNKYIVL